MAWGLYLLIITGFFAVITSYYLYGDTNRYKFLCLLFASFFFIIINISLALQPFLFGSLSSRILKLIFQWGGVCCISLVFCSLLFYMRELKPMYLRPNKLYSLLPLLIIFTFFLVLDSDTLKIRLLTIYEAGALAVSIILHIRYYARHYIFRTAFIGTLLLLASFVLYLILPQSYIYVWRVVLAIAVVTVFGGYLIVNRYSRAISS